MLWTVCVLCGVAGFLIVRRIRKKIAAHRALSIPYNNPSNADIDRLLPAETIEGIFSFCDPLTLSATTTVSKYWNYSSQRIRDQIYHSLELHIGELVKRVRTKTSEKIETTRFRAFNKDDVNKAYTVRDQLYAMSLGTNLIEADLQTARSLYYAIQGEDTDINISDTTKYLLKFRTQMWKRYPDQFLFKDHDAGLVCVKKAQMPISFVKQWRTGKACEMICELSDINSDHTMHIKSLKRIRAIEKQTKFAGLTLDANLFKAIFLLLLPCLLNDFSYNATSAAKQLLSNILSVFAILFIGFMIAFTPVENSKHFRFQSNVQKFHNIIGGVCSLAWLLIASSMRDWSFKFGRFALTMTVGKAYNNFMLELFRSRDRRRFLPFMVTSAGLSSAVIDWQHVFGMSFGSLLQLFAYNIILHMKFGIGLALFFAMVACFETNSIKLENFVPRRDLVTTHLISVFIVLYITLYNPNNM